MTKQIALRIYNILVMYCGAHDHPDAREEFVRSITDETVQEYRFTGELGFGGKFWNNDGFYVTCYYEDATPQRKRMIEVANEVLKKLYEETVQKT